MINDIGNSEPQKDPQNNDIKKYKLYLAPHSHIEKTPCVLSHVDLYQFS